MKIIRMAAPFVAACIGVASVQAADTPASSGAPPAAAATPAAPALPSPPTADSGILIAGTPVVIQLTDAVSSKTAKAGDKFGLSLAKDVVLGGRIVLPAGTPGGGEVVFAQPGGMMGAPGKLVLAARYLDYNGRRILLHAFKLGGEGDQKEAEMMIASYFIGVAAVLIQGSEITYPIGVVAKAKLTADETFDHLSTLPPAPPPAAVAAVPPTSTSIQQASH